ncbi:DMT family transporter [Citrobacter freundii complex sp. CFNIH2]|uniref:DMT family transporter n=1 Tax=Citrobacter TaxID=544 RepID=UPI000C86B7B5|nr:DMT family transporter [Citrobacter freundii complex sp. CFNIH2]AUO67240.1 hypothetical protein WM46_22380 [Citrobacter freundii complex sp. CFNIH2]
MIKNDLSRRIFAGVLFLAVSLTWGTTWMAMKFALTSFTPALATGLRFLLASPLLILMTKFSGKPLLFPKGKRKFQMMLAVFYFALPFFLMIYSEETVSPGITALIFSVMPVAVVVSSFMLMGKKVTRLQIIGTLIVMLSLCLIITTESGTAKVESWKGVAAILIAVACHAIMYVQCRKYCSDISVLTCNAIPCFLASLLLILYGILEEHPDSYSFSFGAVAAISYLGIVAGVAGIMAYFKLQQIISPFHASLVYFVFPLVAISFDTVLTGNAVSGTSEVMIVPFLAGAWMVLHPSSQVAATTVK